MSHTRRTFLVSASLAAAAPLVAKAALGADTDEDWPFAPEDADAEGAPFDSALLVGVGGLGCAAVARLASTDTTGASNVLLIDSDPEVLELYSDLPTLLLGAAPGFPDEVAAAARTQAPVFIELLGDYPHIVLVGALGGATGTRALPILAAAVPDLNKALTPIISTPTRDGATAARLAALEALEQIQRVAGHFHLATPEISDSAGDGRELLLMALERTAGQII